MAVTVKNLLEAGVHFGHQTKRWNPQMEPFIFGARGGVHIIDLEQTVLGGVKDLDEVPQAVFIGDVVREDLAVAEAKKLSLPVIGVVDSNADPKAADYPIPGNDDAVKAIELIAGTIADACVAGRA